MATNAKADGGRKPGRARPGAKSRNRRRPPGARRASPPPSEPAEAAEPPAIPVSLPEATFRDRVAPPPPERPRPLARRAIFLDVENTSKPQHLAHIIEQLAIDRRSAQTDLVAVANWRVVGQECARLLAQRGTHLIHSAPSTGVRDWSDLRIAVAAGMWLASARPGDVIEVVSDDRAFDAVGDVAAGLGVEFRRLSYRRLATQETAEPVEPETQRTPAGAGGERRRRRRGRGQRAPAGAAPSSRLPARPPTEQRRTGPPSPEPARPAAPHPTRPPTDGHTAPHDELVAVVRELVEASPRRAVVLDAVANALKARGFQRPPGSPRLVTRLRRMRELVVSPSGLITLAEDAAGAQPGPETADEGASGALSAEAAVRDGAETPEEPGAAPGGAAPGDGAPRSRRRRRRRRRGAPPASSQVPVA